MNDTNPDKTRRPAPHGCRCGARWSGSAMAHCAVCHRTFGGISGFDKHRAGTKDRSQRAGECTNPAEIGYAQNDRGTWVAPNDGAYDFATRAASDE